MPVRYSRIVIILTILGFFAALFPVTGCKEGNNTMPVSTLLTGVGGITYTGGTTGTSGTVVSSGTGAVGSATTSVTTSSTGSGFDVSGSVFDADTKAGLGYVKVTLDVESNGKSSQSLSDGLFRFSAVAAGFHSVTFEKDDYEKYAYGFTLSESGDISAPLVVVLARKTYSIRGMIVSSTDRSPLFNVKVTVVETNASTTTTSSGEFSFQSMKSGLYNLSAQSVTGSFEAATVQVEVKKDGTQSPSSISISMAPNNFTLIGMVKLNTSREALPNVSVALAVDSKNVRSTLTTAEGKFIFQNLSANLYDLVVAAATPSSDLYASAQYKIQILTDGTISPPSPEIFIAPRPNPDLATTTITGTVRDGFSGAPLEYVTCKLQNYGSVLTDSQGTYSFKGIPEGSYGIDFSKQGFNSMSVSFSWKLKNGTPTFFPTSLDFSLVYNQEPDLGSIVGRYIDENDPQKKGFGGLVIRVFEWRKKYGFTQYDYFEFVASPPVPIKSTTTSYPVTAPTSGSPTLIYDQGGTFKITHLKPTSDTSKYYVYVGLGTSTVDVKLSDPFNFWDNYTIIATYTGNYRVDGTKSVPNGPKVHSWEKVEVFPNTSTYLSNFDLNK